jgi:5-(hydroxymethyl)furfural/furfural oxidase
VREEPAVDFRLLSDWRDMERLKIGFRVGARTLTDPLMSDACGPVFPTSYSPRVAKLAGPGFVNVVQRGLFGAMLDFAGPMRPHLIHSVVMRHSRISLAHPWAGCGTPRGPARWARFPIRWR